MITLRRILINRNVLSMASFRDYDKIWAPLKKNMLLRFYKILLAEEAAAIHGTNRGTNLQTHTQMLEKICNYEKRFPLFYL